MALNYNRVQQEAQAIQSLAADVRVLLRRIDDTLRHNSAMAIDWGNASKPAYIDEDASVNLSGYSFTRQEVSNAIGSLDWVRKLLTNQSMTGSQGDHLGNLLKITDPLIR